MREYKLEGDVLKRVLDLNPPDAPDVKRELAKSQLNSEQYQEALKTYQELAADEPTDAESYLRMSAIYLQMKDYAKAREASDQARKIEPDNIEVRYNLVSILQAEGKTSEAIQLLKDILTSTTQRSYNDQQKGIRAELLERLGAMYEENDQTALAVETFRQIGELSPEAGPRVSAQIIQTYIEGKDFPKAEQEAESAVKKWPADKDVHLTHANLLAEMGKTDAAAAEVRKLSDGKNDRETDLALARIYDKGKRFDETAK